MPTHHLTHRLTHRRLPWGDYRGVYIYYAIDYRLLCRIYSTYCAYAKYKKGDRKKKSTAENSKFHPARRRCFGDPSAWVLSPFLAHSSKKNFAG